MDIIYLLLAVAVIALVNIMPIMHFNRKHKNHS